MINNTLPINDTIVYAARRHRRDKSYHKTNTCDELLKYYRNPKNIQRHKESCISMVSKRCSKCYKEDK